MGTIEKPGIGSAWPVGFGFRPTDEELIKHHLTRKLRGLEEAGRVIPELNIYRWEPQTLFETYNAMSDYPSDGGECFFYCTRDGKNRKTQTGFWKETRKKRTFCKDGRLSGLILMKMVGHYSTGFSLMMDQAVPGSVSPYHDGPD